MENIRIPELYCPFASSINKYVVALREQNMAWVHHFELVAADLDIEQFRMSKFAMLVARAYPGAPLSKLRIACDWVVWMFLLDDISEVRLKEPDMVAEIYESLIRVLRGEMLEKRPDPMLRALSDIRRRLEKVADDDWLGRFIRRVEDCLHSWLWETQNRKTNVTPNLETYIRVRPETGALYTVIELIEIVESIYLPVEIRKHEILQYLIVITNNVVNYSNDIVSLAKELKRGEVHNLALTLRQEHGVDLQEALDRIAKIFNNDIRAFIDLERLLPSFGSELDVALHRFIGILKCIMRGHLDWLRETGRYRVVEPGQDPDDLSLRITDTRD